MQGVVAVQGCATDLGVAPGVQELVAAVTLEAELVPILTQ